MRGLQQANLPPSCTSAGVSHRGLCGRPPGFRCYLLQCGTLRGQPWQQQPEGEHQQYPGVVRLGDGRGGCPCVCLLRAEEQVASPGKAVPPVHVGIWHLWYKGLYGNSENMLAQTRNRPRRCPLTCVSLESCPVSRLGGPSLWP